MSRAQPRWTALFAVLVGLLLHLAVTVGAASGHPESPWSPAGDAVGLVASLETPAASRSVAAPERVRLTTIVAQVQVVDAASGGAIPGAEMHGGGHSWSADQDGRAVIAPESAWDGRLSVHAEGYLTAEVALEARGAAEPMVIGLERAGRLEVQCLVQSAWLNEDVRAYAWPTASGLPRPDTESGAAFVHEVAVDADGRARFDQLDPRDRYSVAVLGGGLVSPYPVDWCAPDGSTVSINVLGLFGVALRAVDAQGVAVHRSPKLYRESPAGWCAIPSSAEALASSGPIAALLASRIGGLPPGADSRDLVLLACEPTAPEPEIKVRLSAPGFAPVRLQLHAPRIYGTLPIRNVELAPTVVGRGDLVIALSGGIPCAEGCVPILPEAVLELRAIGRTIDGDPVRLSTAVEVLRWGDSFVVEDVPVGDYELTLMPRGLAVAGALAKELAPRAQVSVRADGQPPVVRFDGSGFGGIDLHATEAGALFGGFLAIELRNERTGIRSVFAWSTAPYRMAALAPDDYSVAILPGFRGSPLELSTPKVRVAVAAGAHTDLSLAVPTWSRP